MLLSFIFGNRKMSELPSEGYFSLWKERTKSSAEAEGWCVRGL